MHATLVFKKKHDIESTRETVFKFDFKFDEKVDTKTSKCKKKKKKKASTILTANSVQSEAEDTSPPSIEKDFENDKIMCSSLAIDSGGLMNVIEVTKKKKKKKKQNKKTTSAVVDDIPQAVSSLSDHITKLTINDKKNDITKSNSKIISKDVPKDKSIPRFLSSDDPELDDNARRLAKFGNGKNLAAIGPKKRKDSSWLGQLTSNSIADLGESTIGSTISSSTHSSPFTFSFKGIQ
mmetsp:Transcript_12257/g.18385  ORF Transcript_12257/g.18385 Transcript_12257/m.18385 type:complete len:236 (-) Transcript_12257:55-762(-)